MHGPETGIIPLRDEIASGMSSAVQSMASAGYTASPPEQQLEPKARDTTGVTEKIKIHVLSGLKTSVVRNSSAHVRTESQSMIGHTRKKNLSKLKGAVVEHPSAKVP